MVLEVGGGARVLEVQAARHAEAEPDPERNYANGGHGHRSHVFVPRAAYVCRCHRCSRRRRGRRGCRSLMRRRSRRPGQCVGGRGFLYFALLVDESLQLDDALLDFMTLRASGTWCRNDLYTRTCGLVLAGQAIGLSDIEEQRGIFLQLIGRFVFLHRVEVMTEIKATVPRRKCSRALMGSSALAATLSSMTMAVMSDEIRMSAHSQLDDAETDVSARTMFVNKFRESGDRIGPRTRFIVHG